MSEESINNDAKNLLAKYQYLLLWISYDDFDDIKKIKQDEFATTFYATWSDKKKSNKRTVALKLHHGSKLRNERFMNELRAYCDINAKHPSFLKCYGISKDDTSGDYILVLEYTSSMCSLRQNLHSIAQM
ncbi:serine/threonine protein kinase [Gigaspora margarita]|uniref:Serine/threonine protein kinase n=1 Tax=Gigaspora margarita TaxID=4874 RepID=A0A8H4AL91_GIGMA|nr:serine/threonine protein kinase [Gigaspora margarita]